MICVAEFNTLTTKASRFEVNKVQENDPAKTSYQLNCLMDTKYYNIYTSDGKYKFIG